VAKSADNVESLKIQKGKINILIIPNEMYSETLKKIVKNLSDQFEIISYVSLNKSYPSLMNFLKENGADFEKFIIIDPITKISELKDINTDQLIHVSSISALTELSITINKVLEKTKSEALIVDSLSTLLIYNDEALITRFVHSLIGKVRAFGTTAILPILARDSKTSLIEDLSMFVDKIDDLGKSTSKKENESEKAK